MHYQLGNIKVCTEPDYAAMSRRAADIFADAMAQNPDAAFGFATGSTPLGLYKELIERNKRGEVDFSGITTFNLDEYYPIKGDNDQSYRYFMERNLFDHVNVRKESVNLLDGETADAMLECKAYEDRIRLTGGIYLQLLGIGANGHIGFNEPNDHFPGTTHLVELTESTVDANSRFFESREQVPKHALTMGIRTIMSAEKILLVVSGANKSRVLADMLLGHITPLVPASILQLHHNVVVVADDEAAQDIHGMLGRR